ncbi:MAG: hypothetical protein HY238_23770 [Acidobacteria bacterium]|nr:hypothetical protein [Acidobacteriota bacterium]
MSKLTLSVDPVVVRAAKRYARGRRTSVSRLVERYLGLLARPPVDAPDTPALRQLRGILKRGDRSDYRRHLARKYR